MIEYLSPNLYFIIHQDSEGRMGTSYRPLPIEQVEMMVGTRCFARPT
ncbi:MAG: hypothetical protein AAGD25_17520 [Cyanobacteria bacterium P01_F01_bin.150]